MDVKPNSEVVRILSQALRDSQAHANQLKVELENALTASNDLRKENLHLIEEVVALTEKKPVIIKVEPVAEDNKLARLREGKKNLEEKLTEQVKTMGHRTEELELELKASTQHATELETKLSSLNAKHMKMKEKRKDFCKELQERIDALQEQLTSAKQERLQVQERPPQSENRKLHIQLRDYLQALSPFHMRPKTEALRPITKHADNILDFLKTAAPGYRWTNRSIFSLPEGLVDSRKSGQHYLGYGPASETVPGNGFQIESIFKNCGEIKEFFIQFTDGLYYMGLYKCSSQSIAPEGIILRKDHRIECVVDCALRKAPENKDGGSPPSREDLSSMYLNGQLKVECVIFQCVGFNHNLYETLIQHNDNTAGPGKRKSEVSDVATVPCPPPKRARGNTILAAEVKKSKRK